MATVVEMENSDDCIFGRIGFIKICRYSSKSAVGGKSGIRDDKKYKIE
jgi:hypothetical protein